MGINRLPNLTGELTSSSSFSLRGSFESLARETTVSCLLTKKNEVSCSTDAATSSLSNFNISKRYGVLGTSLRDYRTALAWNQLQQIERRWQRAYRRRPTVLETEEKNDRDRSTLTIANGSRVQSFWLSCHGKNLDTNQSN